MGRGGWIIVLLSHPCLSFDKHTVVEMDMLYCPNSRTILSNGSFRSYNPSYKFTQISTND